MKIHTTIYTYTFLILLAGCGGGGGSSSPPAQEPLPDPPVTVSGVVLDGPVSGGTLFFFSLDDIQGALDDSESAEDRLTSLQGANAIASVAIGESEDGSYTVDLDNAGDAVFVVFENTDAEDLVFGDTPFNMESVTVLGESGSVNTVNVTPHTTLIATQVRLAVPSSASAVDTEISAATSNVISALGEDEVGNELIEDGTDLIGSDDIDLLTGASTSLGAFVRSAASFVDVDREEVLEVLALDALDGAVDGSIPASAEADEEMTDLAGTVNDLQSLGSVDGEVTTFGSCSATADLFRRACEIDIMDDYFEGVAACQDGDEEELEACVAEADEEREETLEECGEIFEARGELCDDIDDEVYEPEFGEEYADNFVDPREIGATVEPNLYLPLVIGNTWVYESTFIDEDSGEEVTETTTIVVRNATKRIQGIDCLVVNDVVEEDGEIIEDTDDWFAQDMAGNVWYCGEIAQDFEYFEGDEPETAELVEVGGSWKAGREGAKAGVLVPADPEIGDVIRNEVFYGDAEDVIEVLSVTGDESTMVADCEEACLVVKEFTPLEPDTEENTYYKPGVGVILEVDMETGDRAELISFVSS
ncbi:MAG: hypothetical protein HOC70_04230 [Gammaproteobacteria bacterium]|jgi:hypothetical protein|nr:hypothetical protein [Gammaproteobacteria bacterium]MBT4492428.1 hypothetical protein [Gammaproteobacteria bacterium]